MSVSPYAPFRGRPAFPTEAPLLLVCSVGTRELNDSRAMPEVQTLSIARIMARMAVYVLAGIPLIAIIWETLNQLLALRLDAGLLLALPAAVLFTGLIYLLSREMPLNWPPTPSRTGELPESNEIGKSP